MKFDDTRKIPVHFFPSRCACLLVGILGILLSFSSSVLAESSDIDQLNGKLTEINLMDERIQTRYAEALDVRSQLSLMIENLKTEVHHGLGQSKPLTFSKAVITARTEYNLELIRKLMGYVALIDAKADYLLEGREKLSHFSRQVQDEVMLLHTVSTPTIEALVGNIDQTLNAYAAGTSGYLVDARQLAMEDLEKTWEDVISKEPEP